MSFYTSKLLLVEPKIVFSLGCGLVAIVAAYYAGVSLLLCYCTKITLTDVQINKQNFWFHATGCLLSKYCTAGIIFGKWTISPGLLNIVFLQFMFDSPFFSFRYLSFFNNRIASPQGYVGSGLRCGTGGVSQ